MAELDEKLADVVDGYHRQVQNGLDPDPATLHGDLAAELGECLEGLGAMLELHSALRLESEPLPRELEDFELLRELGRGGMGVVYEARQHSLPRKVALKFLLAGPISSPADRQRFRFEAEAAAQLEHPNIVRIYQVSETAGEPFFAMEFVPGPSLSERLADGPLPIRQAAELTAQVADAIEHAHSQGILHRDLKPSNILLQTLSPKVTDFGLAKRLESDSKLTVTGAVMGTPSYMAPEQAAGKSGQIGPRTDVYALGAILYEALTGSPPFRGVTVADTLQQVQFQDPAPPEKLNFRIPFELSTICLKCLHKEPERRYASAQALADDLRAFLDGRPIQARPDTLLYRIFRAVHQEPYPEIMQRRGPQTIPKAFASLIVCLLVTVLAVADVDYYWIYALLIGGGLFLVYWQAPGRDDTLVERQVSSVWQAFFVGCIVVALLNLLVEPKKPLFFSPVIAVLAGVANFVIADLLSGWFYLGAAACFATAVAMVYAGPYGFIYLGVTFFITLAVPGLKYRVRKGA